MSIDIINYKNILKNTGYIEDINLENVDLSKIPEIENPLIGYANLHNTKLRMLFTDSAGIRKTDLRGTSIRIEPKDKLQIIVIRLNDVLLDNEQIAYLNELQNEDIIELTCDYETLKSNPNLLVSTHSIKEIIIDLLPPGNSWSISTYTKEELKEQVSIIENILNTSSCPELKMIYDNIKDQMTDFEKRYMFTDSFIINKTFHDLTINAKLYECLRRFFLTHCKFKNIIFDMKTTNFTDGYTRKFELDEVENIKFPNFIKTDLKEIQEKRIADTPFTIRHNLYVELGRTCNAKCEFCRNACMQKDKYNLKKIKKTLINVKNFFNQIYIGGGEPSLKLKALYDLNEEYLFDKNFTIITNGSVTLRDVINNYYLRNQNYMISRHSYEDVQNARIFGLPTNQFITFDELCRTDLDLSLACTCIKGGMDSVNKLLEYIKFADEYDIENILFTNLQDDASISVVQNNNTFLNIDPNVFNDTIRILKNNGWIQEKYPIISNSGYELITLKTNSLFSKNRMTVRFKRYVSKKELDMLWQTAIKRTFDLSLSPNGILYDDWSENHIKSLKK